MRIITRLIQVLAVLVLVLGAILLVYDPRLRELVVQDLSLITQLTKPSEDSSAFSRQEGAKPGPKEGKSNTSGESSPTITASGYAISRRCALWSVEGLDLYYSPVDPAAVCVRPPGSDVPPGALSTPGDVQIPPNCAFAPDGRIYCLAEGELAPETLQGPYERGELAP